MSAQFDVAVIGAGPSGSVASSLLNKQGFKVCVLEKQHFPRFVIGESLLPHCMEMLEEAGFADAVRAEKGFQFKNGAAFAWGSRRTAFDFTEKFSDGPGTVFQVRREVFDKILIDEAAKQGVEVRFGHGVTAFDNSGDTARLSVATDAGEQYELTARFVLDASGYGRVLPRLGVAVGAGIAEHRFGLGKVQVEGGEGHFVLPVCLLQLGILLLRSRVRLPYQHFGGAAFAAFFGRRGGLLQAFGQITLPCRFQSLTAQIQRNVGGGKRLVFKEHDQRLHVAQESRRVFLGQAHGHAAVLLVAADDQLRAVALQVAALAAAYRFDAAFFDEAAVFQGQFFQLGQGLAAVFRFERHLGLHHHLPPLRPL